MSVNPNTKLRVGDTVLIKSKIWFKRNHKGTSSRVFVDSASCSFSYLMSAYCGKKFRITKTLADGEFFLNIPDEQESWYWETWMFQKIWHTSRKGWGQRKFKLKEDK